jgi:lysylphosphatidylglycerol synthetase-like protein (DUF2156 family)
MMLRILTAAGVLVSGVVHLWLWFDGFQDIEVVGPLFMVNAVAGAVIAVLVVSWRHWLPLLAAVGFGASTLGAFLISATVGLFGVRETFWGSAQILAGLSELVAIGCGLAALWREYAKRGVRGGTLHRPAGRPKHAR